MKKTKYLIIFLITLCWALVAAVKLFNRAKAYQEKCKYNYSWGGTVKWEGLNE